MNIVDFKKPEGNDTYLAHVIYKDGTSQDYVVEGINPEDNIVWLVHDDESLTLVSVDNFKSISLEPIREVH